MANDINSVVMIGRLTRDPELKHTPNGTAVCSFSLANNRKYKETEQVSFFNCVAWQKGGELIAEYCKKGDKLAIIGHLSQRSYEAQDGTKKQVVEIVVDEFNFLTPKPKGEVTGEVAAPDTDNPFRDDDLPF